MITCYVRYVIDTKKVKEFEEYAKMWIPLVEKFGGQHNGYFLPLPTRRIASSVMNVAFLDQYLGREATYNKQFKRDSQRLALLLLLQI